MLVSQSVHFSASNPHCPLNFFVCLSVTVSFFPSPSLTLSVCASVSLSFSLSLFLSLSLSPSGLPTKENWIIDYNSFVCPFVIFLQWLPLVCGRVRKCTCLCTGAYVRSRAFLVADTQLYERLCPSVGWLVGRSVGPWTQVVK